MCLSVVFKEKTACELVRGLVGSEMFIRGRSKAVDGQEASCERYVTTSQSSGRKALKESDGEPKEKQPKLEKALTIINDLALTKLAKLSDKLKEKLGTVS